MRLIRAKNYDDMSLKAANIIAAQVSLQIRFPGSKLQIRPHDPIIRFQRQSIEHF